MSFVSNGNSRSPQSCGLMITLQEKYSPTKPSIEPAASQQDAQSLLRNFDDKQLLKPHALRKVKRECRGWNGN